MSDPRVGELESKVRDLVASVKGYSTPERLRARALQEKKQELVEANNEFAAHYEAGDKVATDAARKKVKRIEEEIDDLRRLIAANLQNDSLRRDIETVRCDHAAALRDQLYAVGLELVEERKAKIAAMVELRRKFLASVGDVGFAMRRIAHIAGLMHELRPWLKHGPLAPNLRPAGIREGLYQLTVDIDRLSANLIYDGETWPGMMGG